MDFVIFFLSFLSFITFIIGMIKPSIVVRWGDQKNKNRKTVAKVFLTASLVLFVLFMVVLEVDDEPELAKEETQDIQKKPEEKESNLDLKKETKEVKEKENKEKPREKKDDENNFKFDQEYLDSGQGYVKSKRAAQHFIEEFEKQKVRKVDLEYVNIYSSDVVRDQEGQEYPYSSMVGGRYEERGTGKLNDFMMTLVYENIEDAKNGNAKCAQYFNDDTFTYINVMHEEDDVILKLIDALE